MNQGINDNLTIWIAFVIVIIACGHDCSYFGHGNSNKLLPNIVVRFMLSLHNLGHYKFSPKCKKMQHITHIIIIALLK